MLLHEKAKRIVDLIAQGASYDTVVSIDYKLVGLSRFSHSEIHQNTETEDCSVTITVFKDGKIANVTTNVIDDQTLLEALQSAEAQLPYLPASSVVYPPLSDVKSIVSGNYNPAFDQQWNADKRADAVAAYAKTLPTGYEMTGIFQVAHSCRVWGNNVGVMHYANRSSADIEVMVMHTDGGTGLKIFTGTHPERIDFAAVAEGALKKAKANCNAISIKPQTYDVLLEPMAVSDLFTYGIHIGAGSKFHVDKLSPFTGMAGQRVAVNQLTVTAPVDDGDLNIVPFDAQGYTTQPIDIIKDGIFNSFATDSLTAQSCGVDNNGRAVGYGGDGGMVRGWVLAKGNTSLQDLVTSTKRGLLVSRFHYMNVVDIKTGMLTALTRDGLFLIEDGKVTKPIKNLRFTDSLLRMINNIDGIGDEHVVVNKYYSTTKVPALKIKDMVFTGKTTLE